MKTQTFQTFKRFKSRRFYAALGVLGFGAWMSLIISCSPASFSNTSTSTSTSNPPVVGLTAVTQTFAGQGGKADILIVDDNSGSMSFEQNSMAQKFSTFINRLDSRSLNYQIGITTTDISSNSNPARSINRNGYLQDGYLIPFSNNQNFIKTADQDRVNLFAQNVARPETLTCEAEIRSTGGHANPLDCPSGDERGIYAANKMVQRGGQGLVRPGSDVSFEVIFLGDEDVRSGDFDSNSADRLDVNDLPQTLLANIQSAWPGKQVHFHSIVVDPGSLKTSSGLNSALNFLTNNASYGLNGGHIGDFFAGGDSACLNTQNSQLPNVIGSYGYTYKLGALLTNGISGSICSDQIGNVLSSIGDRVADANQFTLSCSSPQNFRASATVNSAAASVPAYSLSGNQIVFSSALPVNTSVTVSYQCPAN